MFASVKTWLNQPYTDNMSALRWFFFVGFLVVLGIVWSIIIKTLTN